MEIRKLYDPLRGIQEARIARALTIVADARGLRDKANILAKSFGPIERGSGSEAMRHLAKLADDLCSACDNFVFDVEKMAKEERT